MRTSIKWIVYFEGEINEELKGVDNSLAVFSKRIEGSFPMQTQKDLDPFMALLEAQERVRPVTEFIRDTHLLKIYLDDEEQYSFEFTSEDTLDLPKRYMRESEVEIDGLIISVERAEYDSSYSEE